MNINEIEKPIIFKDICPICGYSTIRETGRAITRILSTNGEEISKNFSYSYGQLYCKN
jgi:uncharacterized protein (DUF2225 family)